MKTHTKITLAFAVLLVLVTGSARINSRGAAQAAAEEKRIQFHVTTFEEKGSERHVVSEATIEGPPGTDFNINLQGERFKLSARFLTDLVSPDALKVRARLDTRRLYGYSERDLPLYEEDQQNQTIGLSFDEQIVLLPFGRKDATDKIKIEITPSISQASTYLPSGKRRPLEIEILKQSPNGEVNIQASKMPHHFEVETTLLEDGVEIARQTQDCLLEEAQEILLQPTTNTNTANNPLAVTLTLNNYSRSREADFIGLDFNAYRVEKNNPSQRIPVALRWSGIEALGSAMTYDLGENYLKGAGKKYELRFKTKLAKTEVTN